jgi:hypothetical protein
MEGEQNAAWIDHQYCVFFAPCLVASLSRVSLSRALLFATIFDFPASAQPGTQPSYGHMRLDPTQTQVKYKQRRARRKTSGFETLFEVLKP